MRHRRYRVAVLGAQFVPQLLVDAERDYGAGFMEAGRIIVLRHLVQSQGHVVPRTDPFTRIDCARFQGGRDLACRKIDDDGAEPSQPVIAVIALPSLSALLPRPGRTFGQLVTIFNSRTPCAIAGAGNVAATPATAPARVKKLRRSMGRFLVF